MGKVLLFYKYITIQNPKRLMKWQRQICQNLGLTGRILIGREGINGTVGGTEQNIDHYKIVMQQNLLFSNLDFKESKGSSACFAKLQVKIKDEIVRLGIPAEKLTPKTSGLYIKPKETHRLIEQSPEDLVILDTRNSVEWKIGKFKNAILPDINHFRDLPKYINEHIDQFQNKKVLMYCTGGIRCERASAYLKEKGVAKEVYQMEGGIHRYTEKYPNGFFRGKNYVFDNRISVKINDDILGKCEICDTSCDDYTNCMNALCNKHFICCTNCLDKLQNTCQEKCLTLIQHNKVRTRPKFDKVIDFFR